jgi:hypothetical protein
LRECLPGSQVALSAKKTCDPLPNRSKVFAGKDSPVSLMKSLSMLVVLSFVVLAAANSSSVSLLPQKAPEPDTLMLFARQADDPVHIIQASFAADNSLVDALLENKSHQKLHSYRLGWAVIKKDDVRLAKGIEVDVPANLDTAGSFTIPGPENAAKEDVAKHPNGIIFYIAELQFDDGKRWQVEPKKIRKEAADMLK